MEHLNYRFRSKSNIEYWFYCNRLNASLVLHRGDGATNRQAYRLAEYLIKASASLNLTVAYLKALLIHSLTRVISAFRAVSMMA